MRWGEARLHCLAGDNVAQTMADEERTRGIKEAQRLRHLIPGLKRVVHCLVIIQPGVAVPGDADEPGFASEDMKAFESFGMPAARAVGWHVVTMNQHHPPAIGLDVGQAGGLADLVRPGDLFDHGGASRVIAGYAGEVHMPVHRLDRNDRHGLFDGRDGLSGFSYLQLQGPPAGFGSLREDDAMSEGGDTVDE